MPTKDLDSRTGRYTVAFRLPPEAGADQAWLVGDFNDWSTEALPMHREADGGLLALVEGLEPGSELRFRYYLGDGAWENDWAADAYVDNEFGGADSLLVLPAVEAPPDVKAGGAHAEPDAATGIEATAGTGAAIEERADRPQTEGPVETPPAGPSTVAEPVEPSKAEAPVEKKAPPTKRASAKKAAAGAKAPAPKGTPGSKAPATKAVAKEPAVKAPVAKKAVAKKKATPVKPPAGTETG